MKTDKTLGVLGGMGPAATADFLKILAEKDPANCDQEHPRMIVYEYTETPDRTTYLLGKGPDPRKYLREGLETLIGGLPLRNLQHRPLFHRRVPQ